MNECQLVNEHHFFLSLTLSSLSSDVFTSFQIKWYVRIFRADADQRGCNILYDADGTLGKNIKHGFHHFCQRCRCLDGQKTSRTAFIIFAHDADASMGKNDESLSISSRRLFHE